MRSQERYREYERQAENGALRQYGRVDAAERWCDLLTRLFETGHPWVTFKMARWSVLQSTGRSTVSTKRSNEQGESSTPTIVSNHDH